MGVVQVGLQGLKALEVFRGAGAAERKSVEFWLRSWHPFSALNIAVVLDPATDAALPSKQLAVPYPTKSTIEAPVGQLVPDVIVVLLLTSATFPFAPEILRAVFAASSAGSNAPTAPLLPSLYK